MKRNTSAFKERFLAYKDGKSINEIYDAGYIKEPVITPDSLYNEYINSLPDNQRLTPESLYRSHRYWELNDKPKNFGEAVGKGMFEYNFEDNSWHASSVALNKKTGEYEFMKPNWHSTKMWEDAWYYSKDGELFRSHYTRKPGVAYDKYVPRFKYGKLPKYGDGIIPVTTGGTGMPAPLFYGGISEEARPTADALERIANFAPYVGTILDVLEVINGNLAKTPSAVIGAVADVALPGLRTAWKGIKAAKTAVLSAPMLIDKIKNYKLLQKLQKKFVANVAYQGIGTYQDVLDDQGYIKSTKKK